MATTRDERHPVSWEDLLAAISPRRGLDRADLQKAITAIVAAQQEGQITDADAQELIKVLVGIAASGQFNVMVNDFFTPDARGRLGGYLGNRGITHGFRRRSLI